MCNVHNLVAYCWELFQSDYESMKFSFSLLEINRYKTRMLMYSLSARLILDGLY